MTSTISLSGLIERIEAATGPDRELDAEIAVLAKHVPYDFEPGFMPAEWRAMYDNRYWRAPDYTASVDAATTLVPEGWRRWMLDADNGDGLCQLEHEETDREVHTRGKTWALALCCASLRARAQSQGYSL